MPEAIKTILCPVNLRHAHISTRAYDIAVWLARAHGARLHVVTVAPEMERNLKITDSRAYWGGELKKFLSENHPGDIEITSEVIIGAPHRRIVAASKEHKADLIVMESANPRIQDYLLGTTASHVTTHAECSVYVVR